MDPNWKLDRRESGHLFWRRDSSLNINKDNKERVKFRCDVEVLEFMAPKDGDVTSSSSSEDEMEVPTVRRRPPRAVRKRHTGAASASSSVLMCFLCVAAIVVTMSYQWLLVR